MAERLRGRVALVTGGAAGIGRAVVRAFVAEGAEVTVLDRSRPGLDHLLQELGPRVAVVAGDVRDVEANSRAVATCRERFGRLDVLVPNAGILDCFLRLEDLTTEHLAAGFREVFEVNVLGYLIAVQAALPSLRETRGCIVFTASTAGHYPGGGGILYTASKHAVVGIVKQLAYELAPDVRVNAVSPGGTLSDLGSATSLASLCPATDLEARRARIEARTPLRLAQQPEHHVGAYVLLASEEAAAMTGTVIHSDGGIGVRG